MIPERIKIIKINAFNNNPLTSITIKNTSDKVSLGSSYFGTFDINQIKWEPVSEKKIIKAIEKRKSINNFLFFFNKMFN